MLTKPETQSLAREHVLAGTTALLVSAVLHVAVFLFLSRLDYRFFPRALGSFRTHWARAVAPEHVEPERLREPELSAESALAGEAGTVAAVEGLLEGLAEAAGEGLPPPEAVPEDWLAGEAGSLAGPAEPPERGAWEARREILAIEERRVQQELNALPRRRISRIARLPDAPDVVLPAERGDLLPASGVQPGAAAAAAGLGLPRADIERAATAPPGSGRRAGGRIGVRPGGAGGLLEDTTAAEAAPFKPVESMLTADVSRYLPPEERGWAYFRIAIRRIGESVLPVIPKDIVLVQDCSASISSQRLDFCKIGLLSCLSQIQPFDRFNVMIFRDRVSTCFDDWVENDQETILRARDFIGRAISEGETDIYGSLANLFGMRRTPGRPVIAVVVTDGRPTTGLTRSSAIIGEFSRQNEGRVSVFAMGTVQTANAYLLDLLGYCNRGAGWVNRRGRWSIPELLQAVMNQVSRPVLSDVRFRFAAGSACEVYPLQSENLYLDRDLVLYGRCPAVVTNVVFQAVGQAADVPCDMVFDLPIDARAIAAGPELRTEWAEQKIYHLMGQFARRADRATLAEIADTARAYAIEVPYRQEL